MRSGCALVAVLLLVGCSDSSEDQVRAHVTLLVNHEGPQAQVAADRLAGDGRKAIPIIEAAMHTASVNGRKNLIMALRKMGDAEAIPLLKHIALYDQAPDVRREAEWTLRQWAAGSDAKANSARAAVRAIDEEKGSEEAG